MASSAQSEKGPSLLQTLGNSLSLSRSHLAASSMQSKFIQMTRLTQCSPPRIYTITLLVGKKKKKKSPENLINPPCYGSEVVLPTWKVYFNCSHETQFEKSIKSFRLKVATCKIQPRFQSKLFKRMKLTLSTHQKEKKNIGCHAKISTISVVGKR